MQEYAVIRLGDGTRPAQWMLASADGVRYSAVSSGALGQAAIELRGRPVIALVPATEVITTTIKVPMRASAKIRAALPFALEEHLADDIDTMHFAAGSRDEAGNVPAAVASHERMQAWLQALSEAELDVVKLVPENLALAKVPGSMSLLIDDDTLLFNDGAEIDFAMQGVRPSDVLVAAGCLDRDQDDLEVSGHLLVFCDSEADKQFAHEWIALRQELSSVDVSLLPDGAMPKLAVAAAAGRGVNLLQGAYGKKTDYSAWVGPWKTAAGLLLGLFLLAGVAKGVDYYRLAQEQDDLREQFSQTYRQMRPNDAREIVDPVSMVQSLKRSMGGSSAPQVFLPSLRELGTALQQNDTAKIEAISYRAGIIDVRLTAPKVATLDEIQKAVSASGRFNATIQSTDQVGDQINGRIQIRETGS